MLIGGSERNEVRDILASFLKELEPSECELTVIGAGGGGTVLDASFETVTDRGGAEACLKGALLEMESRFARLRELGLRTAKSAGMPYRVIVIEELAELFPIDETEIERCIAAITMKGRAANVFCVIATAHPEKRLLCAPIKANIATRIALRVKTVADGEYILGSGEAAELTRAGEVLVRLPYESGLRYYEKGNAEWKKL